MLNIVVCQQETCHFNLVLKNEREEILYKISVYFKRDQLLSNYDLFSIELTYDIFVSFNK